MGWTEGGLGVDGGGGGWFEDSWRILWQVGGGGDVMDGFLFLVSLLIDCRKAAGAVPFLH